MRLKCLLLKSLQRVMAKQDRHRSERNTRGQAIFESGKESNRKTPGRFLTKTRGDSKKICVTIGVVIRGLVPSIHEPTGQARG